jgi:hypothetical protein
MDFSKAFKNENREIVILKTNSYSNEKYCNFCNCSILIYKQHIKTKKHLENLMNYRIQEEILRDF